MSHFIPAPADSWLLTRDTEGAHDIHRLLGWQMERRASEYDGEGYDDGRPVVLPEGGCFLDTVARGEYATQTLMGPFNLEVG